MGRSFFVKLCILWIFSIEYDNDKTLRDVVAFVQTARASNLSFNLSSLSFSNCAFSEQNTRSRIRSFNEGKIKGRDDLPMNDRVVGGGIFPEDDTMSEFEVGLTPEQRVEKRNIATQKGSSNSRHSSTTTKKVKSYAFVEGPSAQSKPDYSRMHGPLGKTLDEIMLKYFRSKMAHSVGIDSHLPQNEYQGLMELTATMNSLYSSKELVQDISHQVLVSLFPSWLPPRFAIMFSEPFPVFSARLNAWATMMAGTWLMGECEVNDCEVDNNFAVGSFEQGHNNLYRTKINEEDNNEVVMARDQGVLVKRCRFLEESGCASVCVNSCKIPTQRFFIDNIGLPLTMAPNYETFECQFSFGLTPKEETEIEATNTPCLSRCPTAGALRKWHSKSSSSIPGVIGRAPNEISQQNGVCASVTSTLFLAA